MKNNIHYRVSTRNMLITMAKITYFLGFSLFTSVKMAAQTASKTYTPKLSLTIGAGYAFQSINTMQQPSERGTSL